MEHAERDERDRQLDRDQAIVELSEAGDREGAARLLMLRYGAEISRYCRERLREADLAEDVHQRVFIEACRDLPSFAGRSTLRTWLFRIARNRCLDAAKSRRRQRSYLDLALPVEYADPGESPLDRLDEARVLAELSECLDCLGPHVRQALLLHYQQGLTFEEMTQLCGAKADTLRARVTRALPTLRACLEARLEAPASCAPVRSGRGCGCDTQAATENRE
jgi:RNA polymerase sigma-70 factor (ECF subfamily)